MLERFVWGSGITGRDLGVLIVLIGLGGLLWSGVTLLVAAAVLLFGVVMAFLSPVAATAAVTIVLPLTYDPVLVGGGEFSLLELATVVGVAGLGLRLVLVVLRGGIGEVIERLGGSWWLTGCLVALLLVGVLSLWTVADPDLRRNSAREFRTVLLGPLLFFALCRWCFWHRAARWFVLGVMVLTGVVVALAALWESSSGTAAVEADAVERARVAFPHPNNLALYLERIAVLALALAIWTLWRRAAPAREDSWWVSPWVAWPATFILVAGVGASVSRGAVLALFAGVAVILSAVRSRRVWVLFGAAVAVAIVVFGVLAGDRLTASGGFGGVSTRIPLWRSTLRMIADHPAFGVGLDQFLGQYWRRYVEPAAWPERYTSHPHNLILDLWVRLGILGLAVAGLVGISVARLARSRWNLDKPILIGCAAALVAGLTHGLVDNGFFLPDLATMTWCFVAGIEAVALDKRVKSAPAANSPMGHLSVSPVRGT